MLKKSGRVSDDIFTMFARRHVENTGFYSLDYSRLINSSLFIRPITGAFSHFAQLVCVRGLAARRARSAGRHCTRQAAAIVIIIIAATAEKVTAVTVTAVTAADA